MSRKTWNRLIILFALIFILACLPHSLLPHQIERSDKDDPDYYRKLNESEQRLIEYKDNDIALNLKIDQLYVINKSRRKNNSSPLKLDILACRVANKMCREAAENEYLGHWNLAGEEPYLRYAFAGGYDHVSENAYGEWSSNNFGTSASLISSMMKSGHEKFMAERAPNNGHKQNIIDKSHNFVGIGFFIAGKQFRYYEEFIDRYFEFENIPSEARVAEPCKITVRTRGQYFLYNLIIYWENWPRPLTPEQIIKRGNYRDFTNEIYKDLTAWDLSKYRNGNIYEIPVSFSKEGIFYIQIYSDEREIIKPAPLSTKGKTPESGIVIEVYR